MKKMMLIAVAIVLTVLPAVSMTLGDVLNADQYMSKGMTADMEQSVSVPAQNMKMNIVSKFHMKGEWVRIDMAYTEDTFNNPAQYQQLKMMKMDRMIVIQGEKDGRDYSIMAYPGLNGYVEMFDQANDSKDFSDMGEMMDTQVKKIGSEEFAGVNADKYEVIPEESDSEMEAYYIYVDPSKKVMVGMHMKGEGSETTIKFKNIVMGVDSSVFNPPAGMKKYENMQQLSMAAMGY